MIITDFGSLSGAGDTLGRNLIARLDFAYPAFRGHWCVNVNEIGGTVEVTNSLLSGRMGFLLHITKLDAEGRKIVRAAGELLERYRVSREKGMDILKLLDGKRDFTGELVCDRG